MYDCTLYKSMVPIDALRFLITIQLHIVWDSTVSINKQLKKCRQKSTSKANVLSIGS